MNSPKQKVVPHLWFNDRAEEALALYTSLFKNASITGVDRIKGGPGDGSVIASFQLCGRDFMAIDGGPYYSFTPAISLFVDCETPDEIDALWAALSTDGKILMELGSYPFGERFGWLQDKFGLSWQLNLARKPQTVSPFLMFVGDQHGRAEEAINRYVSLFENAAVTRIAHYGPDDDGPEGTVKRATFSLEGGQFEAIDSHWPHAFTFSGAISFMVLCHTQQEIDHFWDALCDGGAPEQCGWLRDRYGVSWQIVPANIGEMLSGPDPDRTKAVMNAVLGMVKIDLATLERAYRGE